MIDVINWFDNIITEKNEYINRLQWSRLRRPWCDTLLLGYVLLNIRRIRIQWLQCTRKTTYRAYFGHHFLDYIHAEDHRSWSLQRMVRVLRNIHGVYDRSISISFLRFRATCSYAADVLDIRSTLDCLRFVIYCAFGRRRCYSDSHTVKQ